MPDYLDYRKSISNELVDTKDRVRNFIGGRHWGEDGRYKEVLLKECLRNHLPANIRIGSGFVVGTNSAVTRQIDIILYANNCPLLFQKSDFIIAPKEAVLGIIEVKTKLDLNNLKETIDHASENRRIIGRDIFNGIFSYDYGFGEHINSSHVLKESLKQSHGAVNYLCLGPDYFIKYWNDIPYNQIRDQYSIYHIENLSFGYFIGNLVEDCYIQVFSTSLPETLACMMYPIEETKEAHCEGIIRCGPETL